MPMSASHSTPELEKAFCAFPHAHTLRRVRFHGMRGSRLHTLADLYAGGRAEHLPAGARLTLWMMLSVCEADLPSKCTRLRAAQA